jgi:two-component system LytT family response regulator
METNAENESNRFKYSFFINHKLCILYCVADGSYTDIIFISHDKETVSYRLGAVGKELCPEFFLRVHKKYIVNIYFVKSICCASCTLVMINGKVIPFARDRKDEIIAILTRQGHVPEE